MADIEQQAREALELDSKTTREPWEQGKGYLRHIVYAWGMPVVDLSCGDRSFEQEYKDGEFVARARTLLPALARAVLERGEVLRAVEWGHARWPGAMCPVCGNEQADGHAPDCALAKALGVSNG